MYKILREQRPFLLFFMLFMFIGGGVLIFIEKGDAILFFSAHRSTFGDIFFKWATRLGESTPYIVGLTILLYTRRYFYAAALPILAIVVTLVSYFSKSYFAQYRPATYFKEEGIFDQLTFIEGIVLNNGASSFPSGHTMSAFAVCFFLALSLPRWKYLSGSLFVLAFLVAISRVYLVQHFLQDIYLGAIIGLLIGLLIFLIVQWKSEKWNSPKPDSLP